MLRQREISLHQLEIATSASEVPTTNERPPRVATSARKPRHPQAIFSAFQIQ
ncbi:hypothetical protein Syun_023225 [Stephania yunnanensis]|uniref:Uncharacterized protein n=1 Tax=Stephania yunnanensis TaxID=152371 RepID=A0AAP0FNC1_9MAGN